LLFRTALLKLQEPFVYQIGPFALSARPIKPGKHPYVSSDVPDFNPESCRVLSSTMKFFSAFWDHLLQSYSTVSPASS